MSSVPSGRKQVIIANGLPVIRKHQKLQRYQMSSRPQTSAKLIVTIKPCTGVIKSGGKLWSPRMESKYPQHVLIDANDIFNGKSMLDPNKSFKQPQLEQIEEQLECGSNTSIEGLNHELKLVTSRINTKRLDGGCMDLLKNRKTRSQESTVNGEDQKHGSSYRKVQSSPSRGTENENRKSIPTKKYAVPRPSGDERVDVDSKCDQIESLEEQIQQIHTDLNHIRQQMMPPEDIAKFSLLSKHLNEINILLTELKFNCLGLQETACNDIQEDQISCQCQRMEESPAKHFKLLGKAVPAGPLNSDEKIDVPYNAYSYSDPRIRKCRRRERSLSTDFNDIPENNCHTNDRYSEPQTQECRQRERYLPASEIISDIEYINQVSADEDLNEPTLSRMCENGRRPQRMFQKNIHYSAPSPLTSSSSGTTDLEQFPKILECESQISTTKCMYSTAESRPQAPSKMYQHRCRDVPRIQSRPSHLRKSNYLIANISTTSHSNQPNAGPKQFCLRSPSTHEYKRNFARNYQKIENSHSRNELSNPQCEQYRSAPKCQQTIFPKHYERHQISSNRTPSRFSNQLDNPKHQKFPRRTRVGNDDCQHTLNYTKRTFSCCTTPDTSNDSNANFSTKIPLITKNLMDTILDVVATNDPKYIALTVILKSNTIYQINISVIHTGQSLADVYATKSAINQAERQHLFDRFLTFVVLNSNFTVEQKNKILGHSYQFINTDTCQISNFKSNSNQLGNNNPRLKSKHYRFVKLQSLDKERPQTTFANNYTDESKNFSAAPGKRFKGGNSKEEFEKPNNSKNLKGPFTSTGQYIDMANNPYNQNEEKPDRIRHLELQVVRLWQELNHIREESVPQEDIIKFSNLSERLRELNELLRDLRRNYQRLNGSEGEINEEYAKYEKDVLGEDEGRHLHNNGFQVDEFENSTERGNATHELQTAKEPKRVTMEIDDSEVNRNTGKYDINLTRSKECVRSDNPEDNYAPPTSPECKKFFDDIKNPRNLFERHLLMMKDFRSDAELRRQRLERKRREQMQQRQSKVDVLKNNQGATTESRKQRSHDKQFIPNQMPESRPQTDNYSQVYNEDPQSGNHKKTESGNSNFPQTVAESTKKVKTVTRETQTYAFSNHRSNTEFQQSQYNELDRISSSESDSTPDPPSESVYTVSPASHDTDLQSSSNVPIIRSNLHGALHDILRKHKKNHVITVLTITLESNDLYHINVWTTTSGKSLGYLYTTESAIREAEYQRIFAKFLTYIVVNETNTLEQKHRLLRHSYEIIKADK